MMKSLSEAGAPRCNLGAQQKWKSWNIIVIQADSGESRISADDVEPESKSDNRAGFEVATNACKSTTRREFRRYRDLRVHALGPRAPLQTCLWAPRSESSGICRPDRCEYCARVP
jgi:hypothetical protein